MKSTTVLLFLFLVLDVYGQSSFSVGSGIAVHQYEEIDQVTYTQNCEGCVPHLTGSTKVTRTLLPPVVTIGYQETFKLNSIFSLRTGANLFYHEVIYVKKSLGSDPADLYPYQTISYVGNKDLDLAVPVYLGATYKQFSLSIGASAGFLMYSKYLKTVYGSSNTYWDTHFFPKYVTPRLWLDLDLSYRFYKQFSVGLTLKKNVVDHDSFALISLIYSMKKKSDQ